jgi:DNA-binding NarL/FixJ family response regulator
MQRARKYGIYDTVNIRLPPKIQFYPNFILLNLKLSFAVCLNRGLLMNKLIIEIPHATAITMSSSDSTIRVLVADDHEIVRYGICSSLRECDSISVVAEASSGQEALEAYQAERPDVAVIDISMPQKDGISTTQSILEYDPDARILILTMYADEDYINRGLQAGALGYVLKNTNRDTLQKAIETIAQGDSFFSSDVSTMMAKNYARLKRNNNEGQPDLTKRETEILKLIADGFTSQQIADHLHISPRTVDTHRSNLMQKLKVKNTAALVRYAITNDLV